MRPLRPRTQTSLSVLSRRPLGAAVHGVRASVGAVFYSPFETSQYAKEVDTKIRALKKDYEIAFKMPAKPSCDSVIDCLKKAQDWKASLPQPLLNMENFFYRWEAFLAEYFSDPKDFTINSWILYPVVATSPVGGTAYYLWKSTQIYEEIRKYDVEADDFMDIYRKTFGASPPSVPKQPTAKELEDKKNQKEGESKIKLPNVDLGLGGLLTTAAIIFVAGAFIISRAK